jgi:hypothetical protein
MAIYHHGEIEQRPGPSISGLLCPNLLIVMSRNANLVHLC